MLDFGDNIVAKAMYGVNERRAVGSSPWDADCSIVTRAGSYTEIFNPQYQIDLAGNALATHDIESSLYGTSLGVDLAMGHGVEHGAVADRCAARIKPAR